VITIKKKSLLIISLISLVLITYIKDTYALKNNENFNIGIYLVHGIPLDKALNDNINKLPMDKKPLVSTNDIIKYNWDKHELLLSKDFMMEEKTPFILVVNNKRIYLGTLWSRALSEFPPEIPLIYESRRGKVYDITYKTTGKDVRNNMQLFDVLKRLNKLER
jgi:hypothetical protein